MKIEVTIEEFGSLLDSGALSPPGLLHRLHERAGTHIRTIEQLEGRLKASNERNHELNHSHIEQSRRIAELTSKLEEAEHKIYDFEHPPTPEPDTRTLRQKLYDSGFQYSLYTQDLNIRKAIRRWVTDALNGSGDEYAFDHIRNAGKFMAIVDEHFAQNPVDPTDETSTDWSAAMTKVGP